MQRFTDIENIEELKKEHGTYYPYILKILGCPVVNGYLIEELPSKYLYTTHIEGVFQSLLSINIPHKLEDGTIDYSDKVFKKISKKDFKSSMYSALCICFNDGLDIEDYDEDKIFAFLDNDKYIDVVID